jgi:hypothetical protein
MWIWFLTSSKAGRATASLALILGAFASLVTAKPTPAVAQVPPVLLSLGGNVLGGLALNLSGSMLYAKLKAEVCPLNSPFHSYANKSELEMLDCGPTPPPHKAHPAIRPEPPQHEPTPNPSPKIDELNLTMPIDVLINTATAQMAITQDSGSQIFVLSGIQLIAPIDGNSPSMDSLSKRISAIHGHIHCLGNDAIGYRCHLVPQDSVGWGYDIAELAIFVGAAEWTDDAPKYYEYTQELAKIRRRGNWATN